MSRVYAIDKLNAILVILSAALAWRWPLELLLFSYAVLGPLHYLTELAWLRQRHYFVDSALDSRVLVGLSLVVTALTVLPWLDYRWQLIGLSASSWQIIAAAAATTSFVAFGGAWVATRKWQPMLRLMVYAALALVGIYVGLIMRDGVFYAMFAVLLPTLFHVALFTCAFVLLGALRNDSLFAYFTLIAFFAAGWWLLTSPSGAPSYESASYARVAYDATFAALYDTLNQVGANEVASDGRQLWSARAQQFAGFLAFVYTYHYLNWFSKTSVVGWNRLPRRVLAGVLVFWCVSIAIYAMDYGAGIMLLFLLSALHVFLEFPLNWRSFGEIGAALRQRWSRSVAS